MERQASHPATPDIEASLERVRPFLRSHAGDVEVASIEQEGAVHLRFLGMCAHCPAKAVTFLNVVAPEVEAVEGVASVDVEGMNVSAAALERIGAMAGGAS